MIRILQCVNNMHRAGLETMLMNYYRNIDREKVQFDFLMHREERSDYDDEIESLGGRIFRAPRLYPQNYPAYFRFMEEFFREHPEYQIVHSHIDAMSYFPLLAAKRAGVPVRIAHSHSASIDLDLKYLLKQCYRMLLPTVVTDCLSCGEKAGKFLFRGRKFTIIPNAIDPTNFRFSPVIREKMRKELGVEGKFVIGHVGRFCYPKNHEFLVQIFSEINKKEKDAVLLLAGEGEKEPQIRALVEKLGISETVRFLGKRSDVNELYQAMDVFVMPSRFEGVPVVGVEAQFAGLPCVFSDKVTREVVFTEDCIYMNLDRTAEDWADRILEYRNCVQRATPGSAQFDVNEAQLLLRDIYEELYSRMGSQACADAVL